MTELLTFTTPCPDSADDSADEKIDDVFFKAYFSQRRNFHISCKLFPQETISMKCEGLISWKNKKKYFKMLSFRSK